MRTVAQEIHELCVYSSSTVFQRAESSGDCGTPAVIYTLHLILRCQKRCAVWCVPSLLVVNLGSGLAPLSAQ